MNAVKEKVAMPQKTVINKLIKDVVSEPKTPQQAKVAAIGALLANIKITSLVQVCKSLGWSQDNEGKPPAQKHYKVAIIHTLIKTARDITGILFMMLVSSISTMVGSGWYC
jgi:hypothetical protein